MSTNNFDSAYAKVFGLLEQNLKHKTVFQAIRGLEAHTALAQGNAGKSYQYDNVEEGYSSSNTRGSDNNVQTFTAAVTTLTVDKDEEYSFTQNDFDKKLYQNSGNFLANRFKNAQKRLMRSMDGDFLGEVTKSDTAFNGASTSLLSSSAEIDLGTDNARTVFAAAKAEAANQAGDFEDLVAVIPFEVFAYVEDTASASGFRTADSTLRNGLVGSWMGMDIMVSSYVTHTINFTFAGQPSTTETLVLAGITFTAISTIGTTAGNVLIGANAEATIDNFVTLINTPGTTTSTGVALSAANQARIRGYAAEKVGSTKLKITSKRGKLAYTNSLTNVTADSNQIAHSFFGQKGAIELANPIPVTSFIREESKRSDVNYLTEAAWGVQVKEFDRARFLDVEFKN